jgi:hypothetical protein
MVTAAQHKEGGGYFRSMMAAFYMAVKGPATQHTHHAGRPWPILIHRLALRSCTESLDRKVCSAPRPFEPEVPIWCNNPWKVKD